MNLLLQVSNVLILIITYQPAPLEGEPASVAAICFHLYPQLACLNYLENKHSFLLKECLCKVTRICFIYTSLTSTK